MSNWKYSDGEVISQECYDKLPNKHAHYNYIETSLPVTHKVVYSTEEGYYLGEVDIDYD